ANLSGKWIRVCEASRDRPVRQSSKVLSDCDSDTAALASLMRKIFTATLGTETNTFSSLPTGLQLFQETCLFRRQSYGDKVPMFGAPLAVWRHMAEKRGWQVTESLCAFAQPAGKTVKKV